MHAPQPSHKSTAGIPTIALAWLHFLIAMFCAFLGVTSIAPPIIGIIGMAFFGSIAVLFAMLTLTQD